MNKWSKNAFVLIIGISLIAAVISGCEENNKTNCSLGDKKNRLIANENAQLKKQLQEMEIEIEKQKQLLSDCQNEQEKIKEQARNDMKELLHNALMDFEKNLKIEKENKELKDQIKELQAK